MDWENEHWVKVYTRDTPDLIAIGPEGRAVWWELIRKVDRAGVLDLPNGELAVLADLCRIPMPWMEVAMPKILARGMLVIRDHKLVIPNLVPAQEARQSDAVRQRESRAKRRATALAPQLDLLATSMSDSTGDQSPLLATSIPDASASNPAMSGEPDKGAVTFRDRMSRGVTTRSDQTRVDDPRSLAHLPVSERELEEVYERYPRKQGKTAGIQAARTKVRDRADFQALVEAVKVMHTAWAGCTPEDLRFCPHFSTFIRACRWRDESLPLPGRSDRTSRVANTGHAPVPPRSRYDGADEDDIGDLDYPTTVLQ